jgi:DNA-directed RNA polymerase subunit RPC12/RpoP
MFMEKCAKCEKELLWNERKLVFWNKQLKKGYIKWMALGSPYFGKDKKFPEYTGKKLCQECAIDIFEEAMLRTATQYDIQQKDGATSDTLENSITQTPIIQMKHEDFVDLKEFLTKSGVVMSAINCPKCNKMNDIPEQGKLLICKHCGNPIKPKDIHEKLKELLKK